MLHERALAVSYRFYSRPLQINIRPRLDLWKTFSGCVIDRHCILSHVIIFRLLYGNVSKRKEKKPRIIYVQMDHVIILPMNIIPSWAKFSILTGSVTSEQQNNTYIIVFRTLFLIKLPIHYHSWKVGSRSCFQVGHSQRCVPKQSRLNTFQTNECSWQVLVSILLQSIFSIFQTSRPNVLWQERELHKVGLTTTEKAEKFYEKNSFFSFMTDINCWTVLNWSDNSHVSSSVA